MKQRSHGRKVVTWHRTMDPKALRNRFRRNRFKDVDGSFKDVVEIGIVLPTDRCWDPSADWEDDWPDPGYLTDLRVGNFISRLTDRQLPFERSTGLTLVADGTGQSAIVSLRVDGQPSLTIETDPERKRVVQVRGRFNRGPTTVEAEIVARWIAVTLVAESC